MKPVGVQHKCAGCLPIDAFVLPLFRGDRRQALRVRWPVNGVHVRVIVAYDSEPCVSVAHQPESL